jgi:precorrin-6Y C5,15-methyltransferase (decarboxylating)
MRSSYDCKAIGIEPKKERREMAKKNAYILGAPKLEILNGSAPEVLENLLSPDAIFIGGGFSRHTFDICWSKLKPFGRIVINAVTLETELELLKLKQEYGGELVRLNIQKIEEIGIRMAWRPLMPVTQWSKIKNAG